MNNLAGYMIWASPGPMDGQPIGNTTADPTAREGMNRVDKICK